MLSCTCPVHGYMVGYDSCPECEGSLSTPPPPAPVSLEGVGPFTDADAISILQYELKTERAKVESLEAANHMLRGDVAHLLSLAWTRKGWRERLDSGPPRPGRPRKEGSVGDLIRIRVQVKPGHGDFSGKRGVIFSMPEPGSLWANVLLDGEDAPCLWQWRTLEILGPDTRKGAQAGTREAPAPGIEQAARAYVAAERAFVALQDGPGAAHLLREADGRMNAAFDTLCAILDAQGSAGEAPALEGAPPDLMDLPADMAPHRAFDEWLRNNGSAYAVEERPVTCWRFAFGAFMAGVRHQRRSAAQGSPARSAPESPRGSNPDFQNGNNHRGTPGGRET
jgi:hypothetical protein